MIQLNNIINISSPKISIRKTSFVFRANQHCKVNFLGKPFRPFTKHLPNNFLLKFKRGKSYIKIINLTSRAFNIKGNTALGSVSFDLVNDISKGQNKITHYHTDLDGSICFCSQKVQECHINNNTEVKVNELQHHCLYNNYNGTYDTNISLNSSMTHTSKHYTNAYANNGNIPYNNYNNRNTNNNNVFLDQINGIDKNKLEAIMKDYYSKDQDHMRANEIRKLKLRTFPYLDKNDVRLDMSDRSIVQSELDSSTDSVLPEIERSDIVDFFYTMSDCLSTHDNLSVHCNATLSLNPVNLKPFYIKPHLTHEKKIKFAEAEMEKLVKMGILRRCSCEFLSPIMLIKKSHSGSKLRTSSEYRLVVDFKYLNSRLLDLKFSYPEVKHILNKIGRLSANIFNMVDLKVLL